MTAPISREDFERYVRFASEEIRREAKREQSQRGRYDANGVRQGGLIAFVRYFWHILEPSTPFVDGWPLWAMCQHLESVTFGEIIRLLMNVPPGFMKSLLTDVFWPAWEWGPMGKRHYRYIAFSYSASLTERDNDRFRTLVTHPEYQRLYGPLGTKAEGVALRNKTTIKVMNTHTGWKLASSVGGVGTGERGDRVIIDDPHNVVEAESEIVRNETVRWFRESVSSRFNNMDSGALIIIMQRVHAGDVAGTILDLKLDYCHLMIPWEYHEARQVDDDGEAIPTKIGWTDPRYDVGDGASAWPVRFSEDSMERTKQELGPYAWAAQYQQSPVPRGGGIFREDWWQIWESEDGKFPVFDHIIASLDSAYTEKEANDPSALTVWGVFTHPEIKQRRIMLVHAWRKHLQFSGPRMERLEEPTVIDGIRWMGETLTPGLAPHVVRRINENYRRRTLPHWGLVEWAADTCNRFKVDKLLIEAKASGISAAQELQNRYGLQTWSVQLCPVVGDKYARALSAQPTFSQEMVYAPIRDWSEMVIEEMAAFPKHKYKDLTDSTTQAIKYLRDAGLAQSSEEVQAAESERVTHRSARKKALYPV